MIGEPVLVSHFSASPQTMRMFPDGLSGILSSQAVTPQMMNQFRYGTTTAGTDNHTSDGGTIIVCISSLSLVSHCLAHFEVHCWKNKMIC